MDFSAILYAALGGGLGGLIGRLTSKKIKNISLKSVISVLPIIIGLQGTVLLYKNMTLPRIFPMDQKSIEAELPSFKILKEKNPSDYKALISILDEPTRKGNLEQRHLDAFRAKLTVLIEEKRAIAPPELLRKQNALSAEQYRILRVKSAEICTAQANGRPFPALTDILGEEYGATEQKLMAQFFAIQANSMTGDPNSGEKVYSEIIKKYVSELGIKTLDPKGSDEALIYSQHQLICKLFEKSMQGVNLLDDKGVKDVAAYISSASLKE